MSFSPAAEQPNPAAALKEIFRALCIGVDSPRSLKAWLLLKYEEIPQLVGFAIHPIEYCDDERGFSGDWAVVNFLKKNKDLGSRASASDAAIAGFAASEESCRKVNERFEAWFSGGVCPPSDVHLVLHRAQRKIAKLLGYSPDLMTGPYSWGPGATIDHKRSIAYLDTKLTKLPLSVTGSAWKHAAKLINADLHWKAAICSSNVDYDGPIFKIVPGGRYDTVPKTVLIDRSIMVEATLNTILQKRVGSALRSRLKRVGVDLDDQSRNQELASWSQLMGFATLDLEAASDSIATKLVQYLLPPEWFDLLDDLRSKWVQGKDGSWTRLEKFSSMGNGFTFELESMIFWALTQSCVDDNYRSTIGIYGDDIIVPSECAPQLERVLAWAGFRLNKLKSFVSGVFFESCGKHYYGNSEVTPAYQKETPSDPWSRIRLANRLLRLAHRLGGACVLDPRIKPAWECAVRVYRFAADQYGPYVGEGDGYVEATLDRVIARTRAGPFGTEYRVRVISPVRRFVPAIEEALLALWFQGKKEESGPFTGDPPSDELPPTGMIATRLKPQYRSKHGWVLGRTQFSSYLAW